MCHLFSVPLPQKTTNKSLSHFQMQQAAVFSKKKSSDELIVDPLPSTELQADSVSSELANTVKHLAVNQVVRNHGLVNTTSDQNRNSSSE